MRTIKYAFLAFVAVVLIILATANRQIVTVRLLPEEFATFAGFDPSVSVPVFLVIVGGIVAGVILGFIWEWLREHKHRAEAARKRREVSKLEREVGRLKEARADGPEDDVLALLEDAGAAR